MAALKQCDRTDEHDFHGWEGADDGRTEYRMAYTQANGEVWGGDPLLALRVPVSGRSSDVRWKFWWRRGKVRMFVDGPRKLLYIPSPVDGYEPGRWAWIPWPDDNPKEG